MNAQGEWRSRGELTSASVEDILQRLNTSIAGLTADESRERLARFGANRLKAKVLSPALWPQSLPSFYFIAQTGGHFS